MKKGLKITGLALAWILGILLVAILALRIGVAVGYHEFYDHSQAGFRIPGLMSGFVPQGFDYVEEADVWLISGYMDDGAPSRVYVRDNRGHTFHVELFSRDGSPYTRHCGGIAHNGSFAYIAGANGVEVFDLDEILAGRNARQLGTVEVGYRVSYCAFQDGYLYAGNFYRPGNYETPESHHITTPGGDENGGLVTVFRELQAESFGIDPVPVCGISTPALVQGLCLTEAGQMVLSQSYGLHSSRLGYYDLESGRAGEITLLGTCVPLYCLDSGNLVDSVDLPPMAEEPVYQDGRVWVMCESACSKYIFGLLIRGDRVFGYERPA